MISDETTSRSVQERSQLDQCLALGHTLRKRSPGFKRQVGSLSHGRLLTDCSCQFGAVSSRSLGPGIHIWMKSAWVHWDLSGDWEVPTPLLRKGQALKKDHHLRTSKDACKNHGFSHHASSGNPRCSSTICVLGKQLIEVLQVFHLLVELSGIASLVVSGIVSTLSTAPSSRFT